MLVFNIGGEKWCKKYYSFASSLSRLLPLTCHLSPYEPHRNFVGLLSILPRDFADTSSLQDYVFICQNFCSIAKKAVPLHHNL